MESKINSFATSFYRILLGIKRLDQVSNDCIYEMTKDKASDLASANKAAKNPRSYTAQV